MISPHDKVLTSQGTNYGCSCLLTSIALKVHKLPADPPTQNNKSARALFTCEVHVEKYSTHGGVLW